MGRRAVLTALLAACAVAGCSAADDAGGAGDAAAGRLPSPSAAATPVTVPVPTPTESLPPEPSPPAPPPTTSGPLSEDDLPPADALGERWEPFVDPGGVEEGFQGNGSWVRAREPGEVVAGLTPIGCAGFEPPRPPVPAAALEGTYVAADGEGRGVAIVLDYAAVADARRFLDGHRETVRGCAAPPGGVRPRDPLTLVIEPVQMSLDVVVDVRREYGVDAAPVAWTEVVMRSGSRVGLLTVGLPARDDAPPVADLRRALRRALRPS